MPDQNSTQRVNVTNLTETVDRMSFLDWDISFTYKHNQSNPPDEVRVQAQKAQTNIFCNVIQNRDTTTITFRGGPTELDMVQVVCAEINNILVPPVAPTEPETE